MKTMILKYNTRIAADPQSAIEDFARELGLRLDRVELVEGRAGSKLKEISVSGDTFQIESLGKWLTRYAAISSNVL